MEGNPAEQRTNCPECRAPEQLVSKEKNKLKNGKKKSQKQVKML